MNIVIDLLQEQILQIKEYLTKKPKPCLILIGKPGTGKTTALYYVAKELGYNVWTIDPMTENLDNVIRKMKFKSLFPIIFHIISVDILPMSKINNIINEAKKNNAFLVLETNIPISHEDCMEVQFYKPKTRDIVKIVNELKIPFEKIKMYNDIRQVILSKYSTMGYDEEKSATKEIEHGLKIGKIEEIDDKKLSLLLDSAHLNFFGKDLYFFIKAIQIADKCKRGEPLTGFKVIKPTIISYYLEKIKLLK